MKKLFIIGNGFDLYHGLPTSVSDFEKIIEKNDENEYYLNAVEDWSEYEEALSYFDTENMAEMHVEFPDYLSDYDRDRECVINQMEQKMDEMSDILIESLREMVENAEEIIEENVDKSVHVSMKDSIFLSFNYTSTLETLYDFNEKDRILHIHGYRYKDDNFIFGYSEPSKSVLESFARYRINTPDLEMEDINEPGLEIEDVNAFFEIGDYEIDDYEIDDYEIDSYVQKQYQVMHNFYQSNRKIHQLEKLSEWISPYANEVNEIIVLGHSMSTVDKPYFELLEKIISPEKWKISQYNDSPSQTCIEKYSFCEKVEFCEIKDFFSPLKEERTPLLV